MQRRWDCIFGFAVCLAFWAVAGIAAALLIRHWDPRFP